MEPQPALRRLLVCAGTGMCNSLPGPPTLLLRVPSASAAPGCRVRLHHPRLLLRCPLVSLHPGASRWRLPLLTSAAAPIKVGSL